MIFENRGFDARFVSSENFRNLGKEHVWLKVKNQLGESMYVEPSIYDIGADSICPATLDYKSYTTQRNSRTSTN